MAEGKPPPRIELARQRMFICRLYLGLMRTITDNYGAELRPTVTAWPIVPSAFTSSYAPSCARPFAHTP
jgi:hypothetical protein